MTSDPLGLLARLSAQALLTITPEYWRVRAMRSPTAAKLRPTPRASVIQPEELELNGLKIRYARARRAEAPTVLFLSPLPQSIYCYEELWSALAAEADLIAIDLPGFGGSEGGIELMSFAAQSAFLEELITQLELTDLHIVAPDIAMPVALHYVLYRKHVAKSLLIGDGPGVLPSANGSLIRKIVGSAFWRWVVRANGARTFLAAATQIGYLHYSLTEAELRDYLDAYRGRIDQVVAYFASYPEGLKSINAQLDTLALPVQVFWGDTDAFLSSENAKLLHQRLPKSRLTIFANCGHFSYQDKADEFTQMLRGWIHGGYRVD